MRLVKVGLIAALAVLLSAFGCGGGSTQVDAGGDTGGDTSGGSAPTFDAARSFALLQKQVDFGPRVPGTTSYTNCRQWLVDQFKQYTSEVVEQAFTFDAATGGTLDLTNIIAVFPAAAGREAGSLLLGAHWDTRPVADQDLDPALRDQPIPGANDGASGVAVLLELARLMHDQAPPLKVVLVLFDLEDMGQLDATAGEPYSGFSVGARYFAANLGPYRPDEAIVLDMIGDRNLELYRETNSVAANPALVERIWSAAARLGFSQFRDGPGLSITDDHLPLIAAGVPAVDLIDLDYPGPHSNRYWHTHEDVPDNCDANSLRAVGQTLLELIYGGS